MNVNRKAVILFCACCLLSIGSADARPDKSWKEWFGHLEGSWVLAQGDYGDVVKDDFELGKHRFRKKF